MRTIVFKMAGGIGNSLPKEAWDTIQAEAQKVFVTDEEGNPIPGCGWAWSASPWTEQQGEPCIWTRSTDDIIQGIIDDSRCELIEEIAEPVPETAEVATEPEVPNQEERL